MKKSHKGAKILCDYLPLAVFFTCYELIKTPNPLITATIFLVITTVICLTACYFLTRKIPLFALISGVLLTFFGSLTIFLHNDIFIKIKPTVINLIFATTLFYGYFAKKPILSYAFGEKIKISNKAWVSLSLRWAIFFTFLASLNEFIWRNFSTDFWVKFKIIGMLPTVMLFTLSQFPFVKKEIKNHSAKKSFSQVDISVTPE